MSLTRLLHTYGKDLVDYNYYDSFYLNGYVYDFADILGGGGHRGGKKIRTNDMTGIFVYYFGRELDFTIGQFCAGKKIGVHVSYSAIRTKKGELLGYTKYQENTYHNNMLNGRAIEYYVQPHQLDDTPHVFGVYNYINGFREGEQLFYQKNNDVMYGTLLHQYTIEDGRVTNDVVVSVK